MQKVRSARQCSMTNNTNTSESGFKPFEIWCWKVTVLAVCLVFESFHVVHFQCCSSADTIIHTIHQMTFYRFMQKQEPKVSSYCFDSYYFD